MQASHRPSKWFWIVSGLLLAWNLLGVMAYVQEATMSAEALGAMPEAQRALLRTRSAWATAAFAVAVFGGAAGCLMLLLRSRLAVPVLALSFVGVVVQMVHAFFIVDSYAVYGPGGLAMPAMVLVFSIFLVWYARRARKRGWLG
ncbi:MAG: hypothetical protein E6Q50_03100 [Lysobacter sp.]|nr:MAG: hypothetical protein E6Q50_03100 [Lysobacter sp.]